MIPAELFFRGTRSYLQGADILNFIISQLYGGSLAAPKSIDFYMTSRCEHKIRLVNFADSHADSPVGTYRDAQRHVALISTGEAVTARIADPIDEIRASFTFKGKSVYVSKASAEDFFVYAVAAFKYLLLRPDLFGPGITCIFSRLKLDYIPDSPFRVDYSRTVGGAFFEGLIYVNAREVPIGALYYAWK